MFERVRANDAAWAINTLVSGSEFAKFDRQGAAAIDGAAGGVYAPTTGIVIGGAGLYVTGRLAAESARIDLGRDYNDYVHCKSSARFYSPVRIYTPTLGNSLQVDGTTLFVGAVTCDTNAHLTLGGNLTVNGNAGVTDAFYFDKETRILAFSATTHFNNEANFNRVVNLGASQYAVNARGQLNVQKYIVESRTNLSSAVNSTITTYSRDYTVEGTVSSAVTHTVSATLISAIPDGVRMTFSASTFQSGGSVTIVFENALFSVTLNDSKKYATILRMGAGLMQVG